MPARNYARLKNVKINDDQKWRERAACLGGDANVFMPQRGEPTAPAKAICWTCPVTLPCLEFALANNEPGVWGGTSERERRQIKAGRLRAARQPRQQKAS